MIKLGRAKVVYVDVAGDKIDNKSKFSLIKTGGTKWF